MCLARVITRSSDRGGSSHAATVSGALADTSGESTVMNQFLTPREQRIVLVFVSSDQRQPHNRELHYWRSSPNCSAAINSLKAGKLTCIMFQFVPRSKRFPSRL